MKNMKSCSVILAQNKENNRDKDKDEEGKQVVLYLSTSEILVLNLEDNFIIQEEREKSKYTLALKIK